MTDETKKRIADFFDTPYLADVLDIPVAEFIERFEDFIEDNLDDLEELMGSR